jgi:SAM-dependent methyltransferase
MCAMVIELACPSCHGRLRIDGDDARCVACSQDYLLIDGIRRFLTPDRAAHFDAFVRDYSTVRLAEGRASDDPGYFRRLPEPTPGAPIEWQWRLRRHTWGTVRRHVIRPAPPALRIADVGAGVGWLSNRLTHDGHALHAVDLFVDRHDGLAAARHFETSFPRSQAEMDALPFADASVDVVVFNASLHYSTNYERTLREALRVLAPDGRIVVMDSPIYRHHASGQTMVSERHDDFERRFGTRGDSIDSVGFLTAHMLDQLEQVLHVRWSRHHTWYGWAWAWKPWRARLRRRREPSRFVVLVARRHVTDAG